ncbi:MAG: glucokinase [Thermomonas sp.]|uniref:glucokinase n=1 Tax=Thermomonas sp. TaxID=1971895 RepID=UPI0039E331AD
MASAVDVAGSAGLVSTGPQAVRANAPAECFVAADVGGTNARVGLVRALADGSIEVLDYRRYPCADYPSLTAILADFAKRHVDGGGSRDAVTRMSIASAGVVLDGEVINSNLPWRISLQDLRDTLGLRELHVINDFAAAAHGVHRLDASQSRLLAPGVAAAEAGPVLVIGPGTGLGAAICIPQGTGVVVLPTEAGMAAFAPGNEREIEILRWLQRRSRHVCTEQLVSGPGLVNIFDALCEVHGAPALLRAPAAISQAAREGDAVALEAVQTFCALLGSVIGDLAMIAGATSVHVAGGIVPQLVDFLPDSDFHARLLDKGAMRAVLERVPVRLVENERLGVIGAAGWYLQHLQERDNQGKAMQGQAAATR